MKTAISLFAINTMSAVYLGKGKLASANIETGIIWDLLFTTKKYLLDLDISLGTSEHLNFYTSRDYFAWVKKLKKSDESAEKEPVLHASFDVDVEKGVLVITGDVKLMISTSFTPEENFETCGMTTTIGDLKRDLKILLKNYDMGNFEKADTKQVKPNYNVGDTVTVAEDRNPYIDDVTETAMLKFTGKKMVIDTIDIVGGGLIRYFCTDENSVSPMLGSRRLAFFDSDLVSYHDQDTTKKCDTLAAYLKELKLLNVAKPFILKLVNDVYDVDYVKNCEDGFKWLVAGNLVTATHPTITDVYNLKFSFEDNNISGTVSIYDGVELLEILKYGGSLSDFKFAFQEFTFSISKEKTLPETVTNAELIAEKFTPVYSILAMAQAFNVNGYTSTNFQLMSLSEIIDITDNFSNNENPAILNIHNPDREHMELDEAFDVEDFIKTPRRNDTFMSIEGIHGPVNLRLIFRNKDVNIS